MHKLISIFLFVSLVFTGCQPDKKQSLGNQPLIGIATESFLADIAQNIAGDRVAVSSLIPVGTDPHTFEPVPDDVVKISESRILIINGAGLEGWLQPLLNNAQGQNLVITASDGLTSRKPEISEQGLFSTKYEVDPHFWLDPNLVITYVENIRDGLIEIDPTGTKDYETNANNYISQLIALDQWIRTKVEEIPANQRLLVTNHENLGYFADRYGFTVIGTIIPGTSTDTSPSAKGISELVDKIQSTGSKSIFLESGSNSDLATQIANDTGIKVISDLYAHALSEPDGPAPTYIKMMKYNVNAIVNALKDN